LSQDRNREERFQEVLRSAGRRLTAIVRSYARGEERRDLHQEILLQIWRSLGTFESRASLLTWAYRVALNTAITYRRKTSTSPLLTGSPDGGPARGVAAEEGHGSTRDEILLLEEFIEGLGKIDRAVFLLYLEDLSYKEVAEVTGLTESAIGARINRIKKTFTERYLRG